MSAKISVEKMVEAGIPKDWAEKVMTLVAPSYAPKALYFRVQMTPEQLANVQKAFPELKFSRKIYKSSKKVEAETDAKK